MFLQYQYSVSPETACHSYRCCRDEWGLFYVKEMNHLHCNISFTFGLMTQTGFTVVINTHHITHTQSDLAASFHSAVLLRLSFSPVLRTWRHNLQIQPRTFLTCMDQGSHSYSRWTFSHTTYTWMLWPFYTYDCCAWWISSGVWFDDFSSQNLQASFTFDSLSS